MENIRDKLNNIPQDFDRELLWSRIQAKKKKKKRFFWIWLLPFLIGFFFSMYTWDFGSLLQKDIGVITKAEIGTKEAISRADNDDVKEEIFIKQNSNNTIVENITEINKDQFEVPRIYDSQFKIIDSKINNDIKVVNTKNLFGEVKSKISEHNKNQNFQNYSSVQLNKIDLVDEKTVRDIIDITAIRGLSFLQLISNAIQSEEEFETRDLEPYLRKRAKYDLPFYIRLGMGFGFDNHGFIDQLREDERELESLTAALEIEQFLFKQFSVSGELSYSRNTTNLRFEKEQTNLSVGEGSLINEKYITNYNLYNNYSRFDLAIHFNYSLEAGQFVLSPSMGFGYNIMSIVDGEVVANDNRLRPLASLGYKDSNGVYGEFRMDLGYEIKNKMIFGLSGKIQTTRNLDNLDRHSMRPFQFSIFAKKSI